LSEGEKGDLGAVGGDGGLLRLRWPAGCREVAETASLSPAGGGGSSLGPRVSRVRVPGVSGEATAAAALRGNKSSRALPRPFGVSLRRHRRACGGGAPAVELLVRRSSPAARRPVREVSLRAFCLMGRVAARDLVVVWRVEQVLFSPGGSGHRRWTCLQGRRSSGRVPGRCTYSDAFSSSTMGVFCGLFQSFQATELWLFLGSRESIRMTAGGRRWWIPASKGSRVLVVAFLSSKGLCVLCLVVLLPSVLLVQFVPVRVLVYVLYLYV